ncbi:hypothetical protein OSC12_13190 [Citrobacter portucalensis]|nr:hypothetical protein [Citrobacter portucalensis]
MTALNKQALTDEAISQAFTGTNFGRDDLKNIIAETVIDAAAGWRCGHTATTICTQLGLLTATGRASALGLRFVSEHVQRETKRLKDELEAAEKHIAELEARAVTLPADREAESEVSGYDGTEFYRAGWNARGKADREALAAAGIGVKGE